MLLEQIRTPADVRAMTAEELPLLCRELRETIIRTVAENGGHLASNLGVVELTVAMHRVFSSPEDAILFDVGHQSYPHKLLTGRYDKFGTLRRPSGLSGFTKRDESEHDPFGSGHSGNAVSAAVGIAHAKKLRGECGHVVAVAGDGAFTNGMIYEALNNCAEEELPLIVILNDNEMSISKNVGGLSGYFAKLSTNRRYFRFKRSLQTFFESIPLCGRGLVRGVRGVKNLAKRIIWQGNIFENLGLDYIGPVRGDNIKHLEDVLREAQAQKRPCLVHVLTRKGSGYAPAEAYPEVFHSPAPFPLDAPPSSLPPKNDFSAKFGEIMVRYAEKDASLCAVTAAMASGTGLAPFAVQYPDRFFDTGIAEEHAVTFCGGLAAAGMHPVFAVYSSFLQRSYDQLIHDIAIQHLPIVLAVDRAGLVPGDGVTHQGIYDVAMTSPIPGFTVYSPADFADMDDAFAEALTFTAPTVVRYPKGAEVAYGREQFRAAGNGVLCRDFGAGAPEVTLVTYGRLIARCAEAAVILADRGISVRLVKLLKIRPLGAEAIFPLFAGSPLTLFLEEGVLRGGVGEGLRSEAANLGYGGKFAVHALGAETDYQGTDAYLLDKYGFSPENIAKTATEALYGQAHAERVREDQPVS